MSTYSNLNKSPDLLKIKTKDDEIKELKYETEKHDRENIINSLKNDNEYYKKKNKSLDKKKVVIFITEIMLGLGSTTTTSTRSIFNPSGGIVITSSSALLTSIAILITNENIEKLKIRYNKIRDWIIVITSLYEKTLKQSMIVKKTDDKEAEEFKKIYNHYLDKRKKIMKNTSFKVEDVFGDIISKNFISREPMTKLNNFLAEIMLI